MSKFSLSILCILWVASCLAQSSIGTTLHQWSLQKKYSRQGTLVKYAPGWQAFPHSDFKQFCFGELTDGSWPIFLEESNKPELPRRDQYLFPKLSTILAIDPNTYQVDTQFVRYCPDPYRFQVTEVQYQWYFDVDKQKLTTQIGYVKLIDTFDLIKPPFELKGLPKLLEQKPDYFQKEISHIFQFEHDILFDSLSRENESLKEVLKALFDNAKVFFEDPGGNYLLDEGQLERLQLKWANTPASEYGIRIPGIRMLIHWYYNQVEKAFYYDVVSMGILREVYSDADSNKLIGHGADCWLLLKKE